MTIRKGGFRAALCVLALGATTWACGGGSGTNGSPAATSVSGESGGAPTSGTPTSGSDVTGADNGGSSGDVAAPGSSGAGAGSPGGAATASGSSGAGTSGSPTSGSASGDLDSGVSTDDSGGSATVSGSGGSSGTSGAASSGSAAGGMTGGVEFIGQAPGRGILTGVEGVTTPAVTQVMKLHNGGTTAVQVSGIALGGTNQGLFQIIGPPTLPMMLAPGADLSVTIQMGTTGASLPAPPSTDKNLGSIFATATLTATLGSGSAQASLYGLVLTVANYEPTLGQILTTLGYDVKVGRAQNNWNPNTSMDATTLPGVAVGGFEPPGMMYPSDEVAAPLFVKAGTGMVTMNFVARFSPVGSLPYGYYPAASSTTRTTVGTMAMITDAQTSNKARMVYPPLEAGSMTSFDPGSGSFGLWVYSDQATNKFNEGGKPVNGDYDFSQDAFNTPASVHRFKTFPLKDASGAAISSTYLVAVEEAGNGDYQDYVFVLGNVAPAQK